MPGMVDENFAGSTVYVCDHSSTGALGLIINNPTDVDLATVFDKVGLNLQIQTKATEPVFLVALYKRIAALSCMHKSRAQHTTHHNY